MHSCTGDAPRLVAVPTHFFKVILADVKGGGGVVGAFVMPNQPIDPTTPLTAFAVPVTSLEEAAGEWF